MSETALHYLADEEGTVTAVVVPIAVWREIASELETHHLLRSPAMRERLLTALGREGGLTLDEVLERLGVSEGELNEDSA